MSLSETTPAGTYCTEHTHTHAQMHVCPYLGDTRSLPSESHDHMPSPSGTVASRFCHRRVTHNIKTPRTHSLCLHTTRQYSRQPRFVQRGASETDNRKSQAHNDERTCVTRRPHRCRTNAHQRRHDEPLFCLRRRGEATVSTERQYKDDFVGIHLEFSAVPAEKRC